MLGIKNNLMADIAARHLNNSYTNLARSVGSTDVDRFRAIPNTPLVIFEARVLAARIFSKHLFRVASSLCRKPILA